MSIHTFADCCVHPTRTVHPGRGGLWSLPSLDISSSPRMCFLPITGVSVAPDGHSWKPRLHSVLRERKLQGKVCKTNERERKKAVGQIEKCSCMLSQETCDSFSTLHPHTGGWHTLNQDRDTHPYAQPNNVSVYAVSFCLFKIQLKEILHLWC